MTSSKKSLFLGQWNRSLSLVSSFNFQFVQHHFTYFRITLLFALIFLTGRCSASLLFKLFNGAGVSWATRLFPCTLAFPECSASSYWEVPLLALCALMHQSILHFHGGGASINITHETSYLANWPFIIYLNNAKCRKRRVTGITDLKKDIWLTLESELRFFLSTDDIIARISTVPRVVGREILQIALSFIKLESQRNR